MRQSPTGSRKGGTVEADGEKGCLLRGRKRRQVFLQVSLKNMAISSKRTIKMVHFFFFFFFNYPWELVLTKLFKSRLKLCGKIYTLSCYLLKINWEKGSRRRQKMKGREKRWWLCPRRKLELRRDRLRAQAQRSWEKWHLSTTAWTYLNTCLWTLKVCRK